MSPITSKKQSQAKSDWMKANSRMITVRIMKNTEADLYEFLQGKEIAPIVKKALREYMGNHPKKSEFRYGMRLRGYSPGCQPKGVLRREDDTTGQYYDIIVYGRQLSADEIRGYELEELK